MEDMRGYREKGSPSMPATEEARSNPAERRAR
jgi:hypothetical protein